VVTADGVQCIKNGTVTVTANPNPPILKVGDAIGVQGSKVTVPVDLTGGGAFACSLSTDITYDTAVLTFSEAIVGPAASAAGKDLSASTPTPGILRLGVMGANVTPIGDGTVALVTFTVAPGTGGSTPLNHSCAVSDCDGFLLGSSCSGGTITITSGIPGDGNGDGVVSIGEVQQVINMFLGILPPGNGADCDGDGEISIGEVQKVVNAFLGIQVSC
jgi:hypothetical protein